MRQKRLAFIRIVIYVCIGSLAIQPVAARRAPVSSSAVSSRENVAQEQNDSENDQSFYDTFLRHRKTIAACSAAMAVLSAIGWGWWSVEKRLSALDDELETLRGGLAPAVAEPEKEAWAVGVLEREPEYEECKKQSAPEQEVVTPDDETAQKAENVDDPGEGLAGSFDEMNLEKQSVPEQQVVNRVDETVPKAERVDTPAEEQPASLGETNPEKQVAPEKEVTHPRKEKKRSIPESNALCENVEKFITYEQAWMDRECSGLLEEGMVASNGIHEFPPPGATHEERIMSEKRRERCRSVQRTALLLKLLIARHVDRNEHRVEELLARAGARDTASLRKELESSKVDLAKLKLDVLERKIVEWTRWAFVDPNNVKEEIMNYVPLLCVGTNEHLRQQIEDRVSQSLEIVEIEFNEIGWKTKIFAENLRRIPYFATGLQSSFREGSQNKFILGSEIAAKDFIWVVNRHSLHTLISQVAEEQGNVSAGRGIIRLSRVSGSDPSQLVDFWERAHLASYLGCTCVLDDLCRMYVDYCDKEELHPFAHEQTTDDKEPYLQRVDSFNEIEQYICEQYYFKHGKWLDGKELQITPKRLEEYTPTTQIQHLYVGIARHGDNWREMQ